MALYDNKHWLLTHIRDSFISTDDSGLCEMVMLGEDIPKTLKVNGQMQLYPGMEDSEDEDMDAMAESYEIHMDMPFSHRPRSNTAQRLEKMDRERKQASQIKHVKWEFSSEEIPKKECEEMFQRKDFRKKNTTTKQTSMLTELLEKCPKLPMNPFAQYAKFDGTAQIEVTVRKYRIFMCFLPREEQLYPLQVSVVSCAKVSEFIGLICFKYACRNPDYKFSEHDVSKYGLFITEDDGEVDWDFPPLDQRETISKFEFTCLGLVLIKSSDIIRHDTVSTVIPSIEEREKKEELETAEENLAKMKGHTTAMEAPLYQSYRVNIINKVRANTDILLGISGEKIEIDPVITGKGAGRFWNRQKAVSYHIDNIAWCELTEHKGSKTCFILVYTVHSNFTLNNLSISSSHANTLQQSTSFKTHDFEADTAVAEEVVHKINNILELRSSALRKEYLSHRERKAARKKSFHLPR